MCETQLRAGLALVDSAGVVLLACRVGAAGCNIRYPGIAKLVSRLVWERVAPPSSWKIPCPQSLDTPAIQALPPQAEVVKKSA